MRYCPSCHRCFNDGVSFCLFDHTSTFLVESLPPVIDGKYRLERLIAHGGMGSVYRAVHTQLERAVAIKILRAEFLADATIRERFHREARAAARLKHPNIVAVYDFGSLENGCAYLVMELIEGRSLREEMRLNAARCGQMAPERAAAILSQVCAGIEAAHRQGIIHRDLKPDNVMIETRIDAPERVLVLDFGIAKLKDREHALRLITDEETIIGTPNYISPEQCSGEPVDARSDVYSMGVILYEMLTGHAPFASRNTSAVLLRHLQEPPAAPSRFRPGLGREVEQVVLRALAKQPDHRFASAAQFSEALLAATAAASHPAHAVLPVLDEETRARRRDAIAEAPTVAPTVVVSREPSLLIESRPRTRFIAVFTLLLLAALGTIGYLLGNDWQAQADGAAPVAEALSASTAARPTPEAVPLRDERAPIATTNTTTTPASLVKREKTTTSAAEIALGEVKAVYTEWANAARRGDWPKHISSYADRVDYFRDGVIARSKVETRKRKIFGGLSSYTLRFSDSPQIRWKSEAKDEAEAVFDRQWRLCRGRKCSSGRARGSVAFKREARGWRIVSEKQIGK
jgi:serine/threonine-protein kinase